MDNHQKGVLVIFLDAVILGFHPIIASARPAALDPFFFASATILVEGLVLLPLLVPIRDRDGRAKLAQTLKAHWGRLVFIGLVFAFAQILFYIVVVASGPVTTAIVVKMDAIYSLFTGYLFLGEKITRKQVAFALLAFAGIYIAITQGRPLDLTVYDGILLVVPAMWLLGHTLTKPMLVDERISPVQVTCTRNLVGAALLVPLYSIVSGGYPVQLYTGVTLVFIFLMAGAYLVAHLLWYNSLKHVELSTGNQILISVPLLTTLFSFLLSIDTITPYHLLGIGIVSSSLYIIIREKNRQYATREASRQKPEQSIKRACDNEIPT
ncbi:MAG: DMT family transporter [Promethearchaeota archaeon]